MGRLALKRPSTNKKVSRGKKKLAARSLPGIWLGVYPRTVHRLAAGDQWDAEAVLAVRALPRKPNPDGPAGEPRPRRNTEAEDAGDRVDGANLGEADCDNGETESRELRLTSSLFEKFGYTDGCPGCEHKEGGRSGNIGHSSQCRQRIYKCMKEDADELDHMIRVDERLRRAPPLADPIRRPTEAGPPVAAAPANAPQDVPVDAMTTPRAEEFGATPPVEEEDEEMGVVEGYDDIPDAPNDDLNVSSEDDESESDR